MPTLSPACLALVKSFEGYRAEPIRLPDGRWLMGYGHVRSSPPAVPIGAQEAEQILREDLEATAQGVRAAVLVALTQNEFDALVSFGFSIGLPAFERSDVLRALNGGQPVAAAMAMDAWRVSASSGQPVVLDALVRRRAVEKALFLDEEPRTPAASALVRPEVETVVDASKPEDATARKLRDILAREPQTIPALQPPPPSDEEDEAPAVIAPQKPAPKQAEKDMFGYAALGALGLLLVAMGVTGAEDDHGVSHIVFTVPGVLAVVMSAFYLLKQAAK